MREERKVVSVVFADVVDSTAIASQNDPEIVRSVTASYFARMTEVAEIHGGSVEKFIGDAVMVVFGIPRVHEDDAERAVRAALAMRDAVTDLNRELRIALAVRVGVNTGEVVAGAGTERQFLVTGDAVNVAARLQQGAEPGEVIVGALTERLTREAIEYRPREPVVAKGKAAPITAFGAIRARTAVPGPRHVARQAAPMVGREAELRTLLDAFARVAAERRSLLITVLGNAGVGKSRLVAEALSRVSAESAVRVLRGRCPPYGSGIAYWPLMDLVRDDASIELADDRAVALAKLDARLATLLPDDQQRRPVRARLAVLLGLEGPGSALVGIAAERISVELGYGVRRYLEAIAARGPLVVLIDDLQWADRAVLEALERVVDEAAAAPLLLVCVARPELLESYPSWAAGKTAARLISVEGLSAEQTGVLLSRLAGSEALDPETRAQIIGRCAGNPLFCEEFVGLLADSSTAQLRLPETIQAVLAARLDSLPLAEKTALQAASVIGERFPLDHLLALVPPDDVGAAPESLVRKGFLVEDRTDLARRTLRFKHLIVRDVVYASISKADRAALHDRLRTRLETDVGDRTEEFSDLLAHHAVQAEALTRELRLGGDRARQLSERALHWSRAAGDRAFAVFATQQAVEHYERAIEIALREDAASEVLRHLHLSCGRTLELRGEYGRALSMYQQLERLGAERGDDRLRAEALARQATAYGVVSSSHDLERARAAVEEALTIARKLDDRAIMAELRRDQVHMELFAGQLERAIEVGEESLAIATRMGSEEQQGFTLSVIDCAYREAGRLDDARTALTRAGEIFGRLGNTAMVANGLSKCAMVEFLVGDYDSVMRLCAEARVLSEGIANYWGQALSRWSPAYVHWERGELGDAISLWEEGIRFAELGGQIVQLSFWRADLAHCYQEVGAREAAERHLRAADEHTAARLPYWRPWTLAVSARIAVANGDIAETARLLADGRSRLSRLGPGVEFSAYMAMHLGLAEIELEIARGAFATAALTARREVSRHRRVMRPYVSDFEYLEGEAERLRGDHDAAIAALARARATAEAVGSRRVLWRILGALALCERTRGNVRAAEGLKERARGIVVQIADSLRPLGLAESFATRPDVRALLEEGAPVR